jgi:hypothetical protein
MESNSNGFWINFDPRLAAKIDATQVNDDEGLN